jgi:hypothetical protein
LAVICSLRPLAGEINPDHLLLSKRNCAILLLVSQ